MKKYLLPLLFVALTAVHCTKDAEQIIRERVVTHGSAILSGSGAPDASKGEKGDYYLDITTSDLYTKTETGWGTTPIMNLRGLQGNPGRDGQNGHTPVFSIIDGYWAIDGVKTTTKAQGDKGQDGHTPVFSVIYGYCAIDGVKTTTKAQGDKGQDGRTPVLSIIDGYWAIDGVKTTTKAQGDKGQDGRTPVFSIIDGYWAIDGVKTTTKAQGDQGNPGTNGQNGADGSKIYADNGTPANSVGSIGDYYIDKEAKIFYGPKTATGWPTTGISLTGNPISTIDYELSSDGKTLVKWLNPKTSYIDMNLDPKLRDVTTIATGAFAAVPELRDKLSTVIIGDAVTEIQASAFAGCGALRRVELPEGLTTIAAFTFSNCINLRYINIPETVTSIKEQAFANCTKLKTITIPKGISGFEKRTFIGCSSLRTLILENPVGFEINKAGMQAFQGVTLNAIYVPYGSATNYKNLNKSGGSNFENIIKSIVIQ